MSVSDSIMPFHPTGPTFLLIADAVAPAPVQILTAEPNPHFGQYMIANAGTVVAFIGWGSTAGQATAGVTSSKTIALLPGTQRTFRLTDNAFVTATASAATNIYIQPGFGL